MRKLIVEEWISLDGFIAGPHGNLDFFAGKVRDTYRNAEQLAFLKSVDGILLGRKTYEQFAMLWPGRPTDHDPLAWAINTLPKHVFSGTLTDAPWGTWQPASVEGDVSQSIRKLKAVSGGNLVIWGSASIGRAVMKEGLVDGYRLHVCPSLLGGGSRLFPEFINTKSLTLTETYRNPDGTVLVKYQVGG